MSAARAVVRKMKADGFQVSEICEILGLHRVTVYRHLNDYNEKRRAQLEKKRRREGRARYECGVCGERGHNARRHR